jgi:iron only hydrogenase large subunit-like protein
MNKLAKVIEVDAEKCVNCHACIAVCPVKYCNNAADNHVEVNADLCIACGSCISACTHEARRGVDDFPAFLEAAGRGEKIVAISAPAIASNFPGEYKRVHGWLNSLGVETFFDVSFGAELTVTSYLAYIKKVKPKTVIAQPCPALVSYVEIYQPELLPFLAPADSPMLHTIKFIRAFYPQYKHYRIVVLSPCYAKRREFDETGMGDLNVTYKSLQKYLEKNAISLRSFSEIDFENTEAERAVLFSTPGGLMRTVEREIPGAAGITRKIEGPHVIYEYFKTLPDMIRQEFSPLLIDCLNCEKGCNGGPGTLNLEKSPDEIEHYIEKRNREAQARYLKKGHGFKTLSRRAVRRAVEKFWRPGLYDRLYVNRAGNNVIKVPSNQELEKLYQEMHKVRQEDFLNCGACGYGNCKAMAIAIFNGLNKATNCFHYERSSRSDMMVIFFERMKEMTARLSLALKQLTDYREDPNSAGKDDFVSMGEIVLLIEQIKENVNSGARFVEESLSKMKEIEESSSVTTEGIKTLGSQIGSIWEIVGIISTIADQTKIIAFNAELEAASAGEMGKSFEIVAAEIRRLADNTVSSTKQIRKKIEEIQKSSDTLVRSSHRERECVGEGTEISGRLQVLFRDILTFSENSEKTIKNSIDTQVRAFRETLDEVDRVSGEIHRFNE